MQIKSMNHQHLGSLKADLLPIIVAAELAVDAPLVNPAAVRDAGTRIREVWSNS